MNFFKEHILGIATMAIVTGLAGTFLYDYLELKPVRTLFGSAADPNIQKNIAPQASGPSSHTESADPKAPFSNATFLITAVDTLDLFLDGKPAVIKAIKDCYSGLHPDTPIERAASCYASDIIAYSFDEGYAKASGWPQDPYLAKKNVAARITKALRINYGLSDQEIPNLVKSWDPHISVAE